MKEIQSIDAIKQFVQALREYRQTHTHILDPNLSPEEYIASATVFFLGGLGVPLLFFFGDGETPVDAYKRMDERGHINVVSVYMYVTWYATCLWWYLLTGKTNESMTQSPVHYDVVVEASRCPDCASDLGIIIEMVSKHIIELAARLFGLDEGEVVRRVSAFVDAMKFLGPTAATSVIN